ncbi:ATP-binding protein [Tateyamaria sp. SN3-11]|uniref:PAS domain-containing sensor histidine kinase n=1 Tax=Tateyamaria sp. SN3-11 TaxID=3092147 RepID=UPI0039EB7F60
MRCLGGGHHTEYEIALPIGNDHMWVRTSLVPVRDEDGTLTHMVGTSQNITPERDQLQVQAMSTAAAREMEDMVCLAAHDLRSPIGNLKTLAEVMRRDFVDHGDGKLELVNMIDNIADKALNVVSGIMAQALTTSGPQCSQLFDFGELCDDVLVLLDPMRVHSAVYPRIEIDADYTVVHIILRNLIDNALKYAGRPEVQLQIEITQMNAQRLLIAVRDNGQGFGQTLMELGDLDDGVSVGAGGFGLLGVRRLARSRGGKVSVMPCMNGAEVQFELPGRIAIPCAATVMTA